jgi:hypothetical protein
MVMRMRNRAAAPLLFVVVLAFPATARAEPAGQPAGPEQASVVVDRVVARWRFSLPGAPRTTRVVLERELAFEARLEAMASGDAPRAPITDRHLRAALTRHIAEELLASLPIDDPPSPRDIAELAEECRSLLSARVGGEERVMAAMRVEAMGPDEFDARLRREARATFALERALGARVRPTEHDLRRAHATGATRYADRPFVEVVALVRDEVRARLLSEALDTFYQRARSRLAIAWIQPNRARSPLR